MDEAVSRLQRGAEVFCHPAWKRYVWTLLTLAASVGNAYVWFGLGGGTEVRIAGIFGLISTIGLLLGFDAAGVHIGAHVILSGIELRYEPGGILCRWFLARRKVFRRDQWRFEWVAEWRTVFLEPGQLRTWAVRAIPLQGRQTPEAFRVITDLPGIQRLRQLTDTAPSAQAWNYSVQAEPPTAASSWCVGGVAKMVPCNITHGLRSINHHDCGTSVQKMRTITRWMEGA